MSEAIDSREVVLRRDCRWFTRWASAAYCRREMFAGPGRSPLKLDLGCRCDPDVEYCPIGEKANATADPSEAGDPPWRIAEWEDDG